MIIAIDPGKSGGIAWMHDAIMFGCQAMPATDRDIVDALDEVMMRGKHNSESIVVYIEKVGGFIQGKASPGSAMFNFGAAAQTPRVWAMCRNLRLVEVRPQNWQRTLSLGSAKSHSSPVAWKNHLKARAQCLYPEQTVTLKTADALLILEYARIQERAENEPAF